MTTLIDTGFLYATPIFSLIRPIHCDYFEILP